MGAQIFQFYYLMLKKWVRTLRTRFHRPRYIRYQKNYLSQNSSKSAVRDHYQMKNIANAAMLVYELLRQQEVTDVQLYRLEMAPLLNKYY